MADKFQSSTRPPRSPRSCRFLLTRLSQTWAQHIWALGIAGFGLLLTLRVFVPPGEAGFHATGWPQSQLRQRRVTGSQMAVLADCIDYDTLRTRQARRLLLRHPAVRAEGHPRPAAAWPSVLSLMDFDAKAAVHSRASLNGLALVHTGAPLVLFVAAGVLLWLFPSIESGNTSSAAAWMDA